jgi:hypothetical protein
MDSQAAKINAVRKSYPRKNYGPNGALKKAKALLSGRCPWVNEGLRLLFEARGFTLQEATDLHIKHMRGEITREVLGKNNKPVQIKSGSSFQRSSSITT